MTRRRSSARPAWRGQAATALLFVGTLGIGWNFISFRGADPGAEISLALAGEVLWSGTSEEFDTREDGVASLEQHVLDTVTERYEHGFYPEAALYASCAPDDVSTIEALVETVTAFSCLAVTAETADHTAIRYTVPALINWSTGDLSWG